MAKVMEVKRFTLLLESEEEVIRMASRVEVYTPSLKPLPASFLDKEIDKTLDAILVVARFPGI